MLYFIYGTDIDKVREKTHSLLDSLFAKKPNASFFSLTPESFSEAKLEELTGAQGLFEEKYIVLLDRVLESEPAKEVVLARRKEIAESPHIFVAMEKTLDKKTATQMDKIAEKTQEFSLNEKGGAKEKFNVFALTDAFGNRKKKEAWAILQKAFLAGLSPEELHGILVWQVKSMLLASASDSAKESGLNPFVFKKAEGFARNFSESELKKISSELVSIYHDSRRGIVDFDIALERFVLENI